ncbi:bacteriorhodopsin [Hymenobacter sp. ISL-91]|uniref:bacteriorhodopsin n=1 Tax=Hymenobacter sp. ISL-91 TaxID=2819151 RepID=UPI001BE71E93|nr:bacteriorhodopsin [Hymenobacter sp. ISL-91]MBT2558060.1 bacteriorhodopsin [Hymenobacter sp. ISL-91]
MQLSDLFVPTAARIDMVSMLTYFFLLASMYAFLGNFLFSVISNGLTVPEHRLTRTMGAVVAGIAALSYYFIQNYYQHMLTDLARLGTAAEQQELIRTSYNAIGQYRYISWSITTPIMLLTMVLLLRVDPAKAKGSLAALLLADFLMILTGYIGEQQLDANGHIVAGPKLFWGAISTAAYLVVPFVLWRLWNRFKGQITVVERRAFKLGALSTVTTWGVYPVGYVLSTMAINMNWIHISFSIADVINKVGLSVAVYLVGKTMLDERVPKDATQSAYTIG